MLPHKVLNGFGFSGLHHIEEIRGSLTCCDGQLITRSGAGTGKRSGARGYQIFRPAEQDYEVTLDIDFDSEVAAGAFLDALRTKVCGRPRKESPAK